jgi:hypothetical protein
VGRPGKKKRWLEGLKPPDLERRLDIAERIAKSVPEKYFTAEGVKRIVRATNPRRKERRPCYVCGRHSYISQSHHLIEVGKVAQALNALAIWDWSPRIPMVSLCPNHHAYLHATGRIKGEVSPELSDALGDEFTDREWERVHEIDDLRAEAHDRVWRSVREEFLRREEEYQRSKSEE